MSGKASTLAHSEPQKFRERVSSCFLSTCIICIAFIATATMSSRSTSETMRAIGRSARQSRTAMLARSVAPSRLAPRQASRSIAFSTFASSTSQSSTLALTTAQASTSSNPTSNHATDRPPRGGPDKTTLLLLESIPQIARYGFTKQAYLRSSSSPDTDELTKRMRIVNTLFPGPASMFDGKLFEAWNTVCDLAVVHNVSPETVLQALRSGQGVGNEGTTAHGKLVNMKRMSSEEERAAIEKVAGIIEERLRLSWSAKAHLTPVSSPTPRRPSAILADTLFTRLVVGHHLNLHPLPRHHLSALDLPTPNYPSQPTYTPPALKPHLGFRISRPHPPYNTSEDGIPRPRWSRMVRYPHAPHAGLHGSDATRRVTEHCAFSGYAKGVSTGCTGERDGSGCDTG